MAKLLTVSQLAEYIKGVFEDELVLQNLYVAGEIYEINRRGNATYITLRDAGAQLSCVRFGATEPYSTGDKVKLFGSVSYSVKSGKTNFLFRTIERMGDGELHARFLQLKEQLRQEGLFDGKPPLPKVILRIAVITSSAGAVIRDFLTTVHAYNDLGEIKLFSVRVQGDGAEDELVSALKKVNAEGGFDAAVIARGGGSMSDLQAFNGEKLARAVAGSAVPVISAVGHETDYTLCDFCAAVRAGTPSIAGEIIANINAEFLSRLQTAAHRLKAATVAALNSRGDRLKAAQNALTAQIRLKTEVAQARLKAASPALDKAMNAKIDASKERLARLCDNLSANVAAVSGLYSQRLSGADVRLSALSPVKLLAGGYAKIGKGGQAVTSVSQLSPGDELNVYLGDGKAGVTVNSVYKSDNKGAK